MKEKDVAQRIELSEADANHVGGDALLTHRDFSLVKSMPVSVEVKLGELEIPIEKLFSLRAGEVLKLDKEVNEPIELILNDKIVATGNLIAIDGFFGIEIAKVQE
ncbi:FliM/FliN family flagellar motor switch protein [Flocculibacter collagenilyticus]|uniref:FliM/FliN family flagellar motor switch protein n=1 Tax=Flocculibacter collagenilyticus TaxID=2744479 RepID=UPI0018F649DE|nr:FliM/FliN family flagellar motor switch protein [Flocculibacter collagenilyticus]